MNTPTFADRLLQFRGLIRLACSDPWHTQQYELEAEGLRHDLMRMYAEARNSLPETGPNSPENASDSDAWEQSRRDCPCPDCAAQGRLTCDECGVDDSARYGQ